MSKSPTVSQEVIHGGGEMGKLVRTKDWSQTPLGPIEAWPQSLRTTVNLCLASNFPISIAWGPQRVQIYNDGYWPICAAKHPQSMGQDFKECWFSAWPAIGEAFERASAGETAFLENQRMFLDRNGYLEETFFTFSFSPIRDETGAVAGLFHPVTEMTQQTLAERRLKVLRDAADSTADATSVEEAMAMLAQAIARHELDLPFVLLYRLDAKGQEATLAQSVGLPQGADASPVQANLQSLAPHSWPLAEAASSPRPLLVQDLRTRFPALRCGPYPEPPSQAFVQPIALPGQQHPMALLVAGVSSRRPLDGPYRTFFEMLGAAVTSALSKAHAYEQERKRAEALAELDRAKTTFFSNVSHEFRTPLTLLLGPLEEELRQNPASRERLEVAHRNSLRLLKLVNTLLDFSRLEAGRLDAAYEPTDLSAFTTELASVFRSAVEKAGLGLVVDCAPLPEPAYVDREMWEKIVLNLLSNAFKFTFQGEIRVALRHGGDRVELSVSDTGVGIPRAELPRVFERFHRVRGTRARSHEGTGIGLALVRELARLHGGEASVQSQEGKGTTFTVSIPAGSAHLPKERIGAAHALASTALGATPFIQEALRWLPEEPVITPLPTALESLAPAVPHESSQAREPEARPRVLLADDNADMRDYLRRLLGERYEVLSVPDGEAALAAARDKNVDLVISDVMMPRLDGLALLRALREAPSTQTLPVLLLSARAGEEARLQGLGAGADGYLAKPFSARELLARVESSLVIARIRNEAQAAVRASEIRYRRLFEAAKDGVLLLDPRTRQITDANPFIEHLLGYSHDELVGKELWQIGLLQDVDASRAAFHQLRREGQIRYEDLPLRAKTGETREVEFVSNLYDENGRSVIQCNIRDMSQRKRLELERALLATEATALGTWDWNLLSGELQCSDRCRAIFGLSPDTHVTYERFLSTLHPEDRVRTDQVVQSVLASGSDYNIEYRTLWPDDSLHWVNARGKVLFDGEGTSRHPVRFIGTALDITEQKEAHQALHKQARLIDLAPAATMVRAIDGTISFWSDGAQRLYGWTWQEAIGQRSHDLLRTEFPEPLEQILARLRSGGKWSGELRHYAKDGRRVIAQSHWLAQLTPGGEVEELLESNMDITERKRNEEQLRQLKEELEVRVEQRTAELASANRDLNDFATIVSHDLKAPLRGVSTLAEWLQADYADKLDAKGQDHLALMHQRLERMDRMIDHILQYSRLGRTSQPPEPVDLSELLPTLVQDLAPPPNVQVHISPGLPLVQGDPVRLRQVFQNLIGNAIKYADKPQVQIDLAWTDAGAFWEFAVTDNGPGIEERHFQRIFKIFATLAPKDRTDSTGVGLALVKRIVELAGGHVWVESQRGQGSTFRFTWPKVPHTQPAEPPERIAA